MIPQILAKSPNRPNQSRKIYDYLKKQPKPNQPNINHILRIEQSPYSKEPTEYQLVVEFQLRREKQKTLILEERLRNKESFIKQMKQFQDQLTVAFEKCQQQLHFYKAQCETYETRSVSFPTFNEGTTPNNQLTNLSNTNEILIQPSHEQMIREYVEEIAELKHLVIRLEEQINFYEKKNKILNNKSLSYSSKYPVSNQKQLQTLKNKNSSNLINLSPINKKQHKNKSLLQKDKKQRSKTLANQFIEQKNFQNFTSQKNITDFINTQSRKISSFINHFLTMCSFFEHSIQKQPSIGQKLKKAWKWVKTAIVEWKYLKKDKVQNLKEFQIGVFVSNLIPLQNMSMEEVQLLLLKKIKPSDKTGSKKA